MSYITIWYSNWGVRVPCHRNVNAEIVQPEDMFEHVDDLSLLQLVFLSGLLVEYNFYEQVASYIPTDIKFLPSSTYNTQTHIKHIVQWSEENLMKLNKNKCKYMIFTRSKGPFTTRLFVNKENFASTRSYQIIPFYQRLLNKHFRN